MAEELLKTDDAAIAIIATTHGVGATTNNEYLSNFYNCFNYDKYSPKNYLQI